MRKELLYSNNAGDADIKEYTRDIISQASSSFENDKIKDKMCWDIYTGVHNNSKFNYLTKVEGFSYPARFRNIGNEIVRSKLNLLESKQMRRIFRFRAVAMDERTLKKKFEKRIESYLKAVDSIYEEHSAVLDEQIQMVQDKLNDLMQQLNVQPENEEMAMQLQQLRANLPLIRLEYDKIIRALSREKINSDELRQKIDYFLMHSDVEIMEQIANASLKSAIQTEDLYDHWHIGFKEKIVTGKPTYVVYYDERREDVIFKRIEARRAYYNRGGNNKWTQNGEWCAVEEYMSLSQIYSEFELTDNERTILSMYQTGDYANLRNYTGNTAYFDPSENLHSTHDAISVWRVWFLLPREVHFKKSPNKHRPGEYYYNLTEKDAKLKKGETKERVLLYDQYACTVIGNIVHINHGKQSAVFRPKDTPGLPYLPLVSRTYNGTSEKPYSLIYRVRELIELYDIVNYKKELTIALAGVRGMIMDKSQKPDDMSVNKWMYLRKMGTMWIETIKKGRKVPATYNQFQNYDDTLSQSIQYIDSVLAGIEALIGKLMGITPPAEGQFVSKDPVANVRMSNEQSALITEMQYSENDAVFNKALELYLNLKIQFVWKKGKVINYFNPDLEEILIQIPDNFLDASDFRVFTHNNIKEDTRLEELREVAVNAWSRTELPLDSLVSIYKVEDINELEKQLIKASKDANEIRQLNAQSTEEAKEAAKQKTIQMEAEVDMQLEQLKMQMEAAKLEIEKAKLEFENQKFAWEAQFKEKELATKTQVDVFKAASENEIESAYLEEEGRSNRVQEMLKSFELKINAILNEMNIKESDIQSIRKTSVDKEKNMRNKNNIKDR